MKHDEWPEEKIPLASRVAMRACNAALGAFVAGEMVVETGFAIAKNLKARQWSPPGLCLRQIGATIIHRWNWRLVHTDMAFEMVADAPTAGQEKSWPEQG